MWFRKLKLKLLAGAYLTVIQLSTGLKFFGAFLFLNGQIEKKVTILFCVFSYSKWWHAAPQDRALLSSYTTVLSKYRQMSQDCVQASMGMPSLAPVLAVITVFVSMSTMWVERPSGLALLHVYRDISIDTDKIVQEFCARKCHSLAFEFCTQTFLWPYIFECHSALSLHHSYWIEVGKYNIYVNWL